MFYQHFGPKTATVACGLGLAASLLGTATPAIAAEFTGPSGTTEVKVEATAENMKFRVPTVISFAADAAGELTGPSADATKIENLSVFGIHVTGMKVAQESPWNIVADKEAAAAASTDNNIAFSVGPDGAVRNAADAMGDSGVDLSGEHAYNMSYQGDQGDAVKLLSSGSVAKVSGGALQDEGSKVATITWTLAPGNAQ